MTKKEKLLQKINQAFANSDIEFIIDHVTDDIQWDVVNDFSIQGREKFIEALKEMVNDQPFSLNIKNIITHGDSAAVDGEIESPEGKRYAFSDIYKFREFKNPKIKKMTSYVIELKK